MSLLTLCLKGWGVILQILQAAGLNSRGSWQRRNHLLPKSGQEATRQPRLSSRINPGLRRLSGPRQLSLGDEIGSGDCSVLLSRNGEGQAGKLGP